MLKKGLLLVVLVILAFFSVLYASNSSEEVDTNYDEIRTLEIRKSDIELELDALQREYDIKINGSSLVFLLFRDFDVKYYDDIIDLFERYGYYGTLILSEDDFPDKENYLSVDQFNNLIKKGWNYCILYENDKQFEYLKKLFDVNGMKTDTVYFNEGKYSLALDNYVKSLGFKSVVHHGEDNLNMYKDSLDNGIWHIGSMGLFGSSPKNKLIETLNQHGSFAYTIGFNKKLTDEYIDLETLSLAIDTFNGFVNKDQLKVTDLERGFQYISEVKRDYDMNNKEYHKRKKELESELKEIEKEIKELER